MASKEKPKKVDKKKEKKIRILAAGDIHGNSLLAGQLAKKAKEENVEIVILTGDLTNAGRGIENLIGQFLKVGKKVLMLPGNHDPLELINALPEIYKDTKNIHGYAVKHKNVGVFGAGSADIGLFVLEDDKLFNVLEKGFKYVKDMQTVY